MEITIHRGSKEIGGTCIEITSEKGKKILVDAGSPLDDSNPDTSYIENEVDAILISHPHQDHYGLLEGYNGGAKIYIGEVALDFINAAKLFIGKQLLEGDFTKIKAYQTIEIEDNFKVTPYLTDHSTPESFAFLIEADGKKVYYSGDFRATGRKKNLFENTLKRPPKDIDVLLMEGTMIEREQHKYPTEESVEKAMYEIARNQKNISCVVSSAQNIDRLISIVRVCRRLNKQLVIDPYTAWLLDALKKQSKNVPTMDWDEIAVYLNPSHMNKIDNELHAKFIERLTINSVGSKVFSEPSKYIYFERNPNQKFHEPLLKFGPINIVYSQWEGYLKEEFKQYFTENINELKNHPSYQFYSIHTSGHAVVKDLLSFAKAINSKLVYPIHTAYPKRFKDIFEKNGFSNVSVLQDGVNIRI